MLLSGNNIPTLPHLWSSGFCQHSLPDHWKAWAKPLQVFLELSLLRSPHGMLQILFSVRLGRPKAGFSAAEVANPGPAGHNVIHVLRLLELSRKKKLRLACKLSSKKLNLGRRHSERHQSVADLLPRCRFTPTWPQKWGSRMKKGTTLSKLEAFTTKTYPIYSNLNMHYLCKPICTNHEKHLSKCWFLEDAALTSASLSWSRRHLRNHTPAEGIALSFGLLWGMLGLLD